VLLSFEITQHAGAPELGVIHALIGLLEISREFIKAIRERVGYTKGHDCRGNHSREN
jgi:hypothetical protein